MRRPTPPVTLVALLLTLLVAACGDAEAPAAARRPPALSGVLNPWDTIPPESIYGATPVENLRVVQAELDLLGIPQGWEGMRVAVLSDFQLGLWDGNQRVAEAAVRTAAASDADLIVLLGDYIATGSDTAALARVLAPLRGKTAIAVLGDRDIRSDSLAAAVTRTLSAQGVRVLRNGSVPFGFGSDTALIAGVDPELATKPVGDQEWVLSQMGGGTRPALLLSHVPQLAARADARFPGVLAGNTFCGRVEVPGTPRLSWLASQALPGTAVPQAPRLFRIKRSVLFVTCGLGYGFTPVRFGAPPELALLTLHPVSVGAPATPRDSVSIDTLIQRYQRRDTTAAGDTAS